MLGFIAYTEGRAVVCHSEAKPKNLVVGDAVTF